ncbi:MAG: hypothetical protein LC650_00740 [Actinobacteria bacterium]|nr:hypothetical protein [Actinomycetota bacterium]
MLFAITTEELFFATPDRVLISLPAGRPVVVTGTDGVGEEMTYAIETELGEANEAVPASSLDFDADW